MRIINFYKIFFKREVVIFLCFLILPLFSFSQSCANYAVARTTGITYTSIAGASPSNFTWRNIASNQNDDNRSYQAPIGFDFWYLGVRYTQFSGDLNGFIDFSASTSDGNSALMSAPYAYAGNYMNVFSTANASMLAVAPLYDDLWTAGSGTTPIASCLVYKTTGSAPNRVLTVEWINFDKFGSSTGSLNFQVKLYETTGVIEFIYGTMTAGSAALVYCCGINSNWAAGAPTAAQLLTQQTANTTTFNNTPQNSLSTMPTSNSKLTFTPPTPTAAPTGLSFTAVTKVGMTLNWTDNAANEDGYVIYNSTDNVNFSFVTQVAANSVSAAIAGLFPSTTYYWQVYAVTEGKLSAALTGTKATSPALRIISIANGNWGAAGTWDCGCVPTAGDSAIIANGTTVILNTNGICYSLTVGQGASGQLTIGNNGTVRTLTVSKDVRVLAGATMTIGATAANHTMSMGGNLTNNGTFNLAPTATRICDITFNKNGNQTISGAGATTNFNLIILNMGTSNTNVLDVASTNFTVVPANFLTDLNGTLKISTATAVITPMTGNVTIPVTGGIWLNNAGVTMSTTGGTITLYGSLRATAGTINIGNASDNNLTSYGGVITIDGGTVNIAGSLTKAGPTILTYFTMSSGTLKVATVGSTTALAPFQMDEIGSTFNMSGGTIIIERTGAGNMGYINTGGTVGSVTGGTLQMGDASTPGAPTMQINSSIVVYNLVVASGAAVTAQLVTNSLTVNNNFTINTPGIFNPAGLNLTVSGSSTINGTFADATAAGTSTLQNVDLSGGTIGGAANGVVNMQNLTMPTGNGTIGQVILTVNGTTTIPAGFGLTINNNTAGAIKTFIGAVTVNGTGSWTSTLVTTQANLVFQNGIVSNGTSFAAGGATFNTNAQSISGATTVSFANTVTVTGITVTNNATVTMSNTAAATLTGTGTWTQGATGVLNYSGSTITVATLNASAAGNAVNYNSPTAIQTIFNPSASTYNNLSITGGAFAKTLAASTIINGDISIQGTAIFSVNTFDITLYGNWNNSSTNADPFTEGVRAVAFSGTTAGQTITNTGNANGTKFYNLTFSNTFATAPQISFAAATDVIVGNALSLGSNDQVNLNGRTFTIGTSAAVTGTLTYVSGFLYGGNVTRWMAVATYAVNNAKGHFPIGTSAGDYRPFFLGITTANLTTGGTITLSHTAVYPATYNVASHTDVTWTPPPGGTVLQGESQSSWNVSTGGGIVAAAGTRFDISFGGAGFGTNTLTDIDATLAASTVGTFAAATGIPTAVMANRTGLTLAQLNNGGTQNFLLGTKNINQSPLPVELLSFDAKPDGNVVDVTWKTASEFNSAYFVVQRSKDGTVFNDVAQEQGVGNSSTVKKYSAVDHEPYNDVSYYRLKQVDNDGKFTYSGLVAVKFHNENVILVYPNPSFQGEPINVSISGQNGKEVLVVVHDLQGKEFYSKVIIFSSDVEAIAIDPSGKLAPGVYFVVATSDNNIYEKKIVIK